MQANCANELEVSIAIIIFNQLGGKIVLHTGKNKETIHVS